MWSEEKTALVKIISYLLGGENVVKNFNIIDEAVKIIGAVVSNIQSGGVVSTNTTRVGTGLNPVYIIGNRGVIISNDHVMPGAALDFGTGVVFGGAAIVPISIPIGIYTDFVGSTL